MSRPLSGTVSTREQAFDRILKKITGGELRPGEAISELSLARELNTSRTPVREAISQLVAEGFLAHIPSRGTVVVQLRRSDIVDLYEVREALEVYAVIKAAHRTYSPSETKRLLSSVKEPLLLKQELERSGRENLDTAEMQRFGLADMTFHTLLMHAAGNPRILKVVNDSRLLLRIFALYHAGHTAAELDSIYRQHQGVLDAVLQQDATRAADLLGQHIRISMQERLDAFDDWDRRSSIRLEHTY